MARYLLDPVRSRVVIDATSSLHPIRSEASGLEGWLELDVRGEGEVNPNADVGAHLELPVNELRSGNPLEERELRRRIDARRFPTIDGDLTTIGESGRDGHYRVRGDITFRGVTRSCEDEVTITSEGDGTLRVQGSSEFDVRDFGMEPPRILLLRVHPEVRVEIDVVAVKED